MNKEYMARMSASELDEYGKLIGVATSPGKTATEKARIIDHGRERTASIRVLGIDLEIPIKRTRDKRVSDLLYKDGRTDAETEEVMRLLLGDDQMGEVTRACTDEDGTVDIDALGLAFAKIITSDELKN